VDINRNLSAAESKLKKWIKCLRPTTDASTHSRTLKALVIPLEINDTGVLRRGSGENKRKRKESKRKNQNLSGQPVLQLTSDSSNSQGREKFYTRGKRVRA